ncbi:glycosyltransferase [Novosphingobium sp. FSW06-99]|uniref:glycosyltransferase n=1 Tax=Novosphingobium sp. FSW06-99 TaxID=1739113 RepID=UPI00076BEBE0|nr:glycosyltransferase [Novosphingobium sp. FSW06-99]KUR78189.1 hypothetical protein AQZ49_07600 [Novosphingobium sp. FSW06-99]
MQPVAALYISYDGMLEPLGQSQVITYLERLGHVGRFHVISYEKPADWSDADRRAAVAARFARAGIVWHPLRYHKRPLIVSTLYDLAVGMVVSITLALRWKIGVFHARSVLCSVLCLPAVTIRRGALISDIRGFWPDERVDGGSLARGGLVHRVLKRLERLALRRSREIVVLTAASVPILRGDPAFGLPTAPITVIPTCADLARFVPATAGPPAVFTLGYVGSIGTWYCFDEVLACFALIRARRADARLLVVNRTEQDRVRALVADSAIDPAHVTITGADHAGVPDMIRRMSAGAAIISPVFSKQASAPTKLAEYLGCGVPCLGNVGVGDMAQILEGEGAGVALTAFTPEARAIAVDRLLALCAQPGIAAQCRAVAERHFSVETGAQRYAAIYRRIAQHG